ncbi:MAG: glycosyltransferase family 39 protein [Candidatus Bathyarchaeota archaeon]|nr:glycosyltransferase family 39 protein [Candidatus Bathyarchaeota archaeon]
MQLTLGIFLTTSVLGLVSWAAMIIHNLDVIPSVATLVTVATISTLLMLKKGENKQNLKVQSPDKQIFSLQFVVSNVIYLLLTALSFYLLLISRRGEAYVVWWSVHPLFLPVFFLATLALVITIFISHMTAHKLGLIMVHSFLSVSLFLLIFPFGDVGGQQYVLGTTRLIYDNQVLHGIRFPVQSIGTQVYLWLRGDSFQAAISVILARMLSVDVMWVHLSLVPILWGIFVPLGIFLITRTLTKNDNVAAISALLIATFTYTLRWGTMSVYNSLGFIFFLYSVYCFLEYLSSNQPKKWVLPMLIFVFLSFAAHFLTGIMAFSLLLLVLIFRMFENRSMSLVSTKLPFLIIFVFCTYLLPTAITYRRFLYPENSYFGLDKLVALSREDILWMFLLGEYANFDIRYAIVHILGPALGILGMLYYFYITRQKSSKKPLLCTTFLFTGLLIVLADYRILKLFVVSVPFAEERLWVFRDFLIVPFVGILVNDVFPFLHKQVSTISIPFSTSYIRRIALYSLIFVTLSGWITISLYYAYPHYGPLQTTTYEIEAVKFIEESTTEPYVVLGDQWITFAGGMIVGIGNPNALYFHSKDPKGLMLFIEMKTNSTTEPMKKAMTCNNATVAYFVIDKPRLRAEEYTRIIQQAQQNSLQTYKIFYYENEEKLRIFYHKE